MPKTELSPWILIATDWPSWVDDPYSSVYRDNKETVTDLLHRLERGPVYARCVTHEHSAALPWEDSLTVAVIHYNERNSQ